MKPISAVTGTSLNAGRAVKTAVARCWGPPARRLRFEQPHSPVTPLSVLIYPPKACRPATMFATAGMSGVPMPATGDRAELIFATFSMLTRPDELAIGRQLAALADHPWQTAEPLAAGNLVPLEADFPGRPRHTKVLLMSPLPVASVDLLPAAVAGVVLLHVVPLTREQADVAAMLPVEKLRSALDGAHDAG